MAHPYALFGPDGRPVDPGASLDGPPAGSGLRDIATEVKGGSPAGGAHSTATDMIAFARALTGHVLLGAPLTAALTTGKVDIPVATPGPGATPARGPGPAPGSPPRTPPRYGYGFLVEERNGTRSFGHNGGTPGYEAELAIFPDSGRAAVVLTNQDAALPPVMRSIKDLLSG
jgi:hypothetical protein